MSRGRVYAVDDNDSHRIPIQVTNQEDPWTCLLEVSSLERPNTRCKYDKIYAFTSDNSTNLPQYTLNF